MDTGQDLNVNRSEGKIGGGTHLNFYIIRREFAACEGEDGLIGEVICRPIKNRGLPHTTW